MQLDHGDRRPSQRLPVNPRRHKVAPGQRKRVATACNSCNVRRIKCSGDHPCSQCASTARDCAYPVLVEKVSVPKSELDELKKKVEVYEKALQDVLPDPTRRLELLHHAASPDSSSSASPYPSSALHGASGGSKHLSGASSIKTEPTDDDGHQVFSPGRLLQDADGMGRYVGETSGATFLDHLKELMGAAMPMTQPVASADTGSSFLSSLGSCITYDSRPVLGSPTDQVDALWLPPDTAIAAVLSELRHFIQDGGGLWPSGGIYWWGDLDTMPLRAPEPPASVSGEAGLNDHRHLAFYHAALAVACQSTTTQSFPGLDAHLSHLSLSEPYFARAAVLLGNPLDIKRRTIGDVAALALMGFYLIETNRPDAAYMYVAAAIHISIMLGAHRGWVDEKGKRVFWSVYALDRWLSCLMGRPPTITDDAIQLPLPADAPSMPPAAGLRAHVELSRISGHVVGNTYHGSKGGVGSASGARQPENAIWMLQQWQSSLPSPLRLSVNGLSDDPAVCLLHMRYNQLLVVAIRPLFFSAVKRAVAERLMAQPHPLPSSNQQQQLGHLSCCIAAAADNMRLARHVITLNGHRKLLHAGLHFIFNAAVCLILRRLVAAPEEQEGDDEVRQASDGIEFAIQRLLDASQAGNGDGRRCAETLRDLVVLVGRLTVPTAAAPPGSILGCVGQPAHAGNAIPLPSMGSQELPAPPPMSIGEDPILYDELMTWMGDDWPVYNGYIAG